MFLKQEGNFSVTGTPSEPQEDFIKQKKSFCSLWTALYKRLSGQLDETQGSTKIALQSLKFILTAKVNR